MGPADLSGQDNCFGLLGMELSPILHQGEDGIQFVATPAGYGPGPGPDAVPVPPPQSGRSRVPVPHPGCPLNPRRLKRTNDYNRVFPRP
jgi:hypothetical protein